MAIHQKVALNGVRFYAYHGLYPEEQVIGGEFFVDIETGFESGAGDKSNLSNTVDYSSLYRIANSRMEIPRKLIEEVAHDILKDIQTEFSYLKVIIVRIRKMHPPLPAELNNAEVELTYMNRDAV